MRENESIHFENLLSLSGHIKSSIWALDQIINNNERRMTPGRVLSRTAGGENRMPSVYKVYVLDKKTTKHIRTHHEHVGIKDEETRIAGLCFAMGLLTIASNFQEVV
jgi:hypothetical protein